MLTVQNILDGWRAGWIEQSEDLLFWLAAEHAGRDISDLETGTVAELEAAINSVVEAELGFALDEMQNPLWSERIEEREEGGCYVAFQDGTKVALRPPNGGDLMKVRGRTLFDRELEITRRLTNLTLKDILAWSAADYMNVQGAITGFLD